MSNTINAIESNSYEPCLELPFHGVDAKMAQSSGGYSSDSPLLMFLFLLMRDFLPTSKVEQLVRDCGIASDGMKYSNAYLAKYAADLAFRLTDADSAKQEQHVEYILKAENTYEERRMLAEFLGVPTERMSEVVVHDSAGRMLRRVQKVNLQTGAAVVHLATTEFCSASVDGTLLEVPVNLSGCFLHFPQYEPSWEPIADVAIPIRKVSE